MNKQKCLQIARFLVGGGFGAIAYYAVLYSLTEFVGLWYVFSAVVAFIFNNGINFLVQKFWTFKNTDTKTAPVQFTLYFGMGIGLLVFNVVLLYILVEYAHLYYLVAQLILTVIVTVSSFVITGKIFAK